MCRHHSHTAGEPPSESCTVNRRKFLAATGAAAIAAEAGVFDFASSLYAKDSTSSKKPKIRAVFVRPDTDKYWLGWPGASYDIPGHQRQYTKIMKDAAKKMNIDLEITEAPLHDDDTVNSFLSSLTRTRPDGVLITAMSLNDPAWQNINRIAENRGPIPTVVFSPMGTSFTQHLQGTRNIDNVYVGATQDVEWLADALKMLKVVWQMKNSRICVVRGEKTEDRVLDVIGTTLHYIPRTRFPETIDSMETTDEMQAITDYYMRYAKMILEPERDDVLNAVKNYVASKKIMEQENCDGISVDCLPLVGQRKIFPPCLSWARLNDEGSVGACEADWNAAISLRLTSYLCDRPGFIQDPAPNTVNNTLMGAHCSCPTKLRGFDEEPEPFIFRSHSESDIGCSVQVLWEEGQRATIMKFEGPEKIILGTGTVLRNIDTPPSGGCRSSVELVLDDVPNALDTKGFHQLFIYGDLENKFKAYCSLAGIAVEHI